MAVASLSTWKGSSLTAAGRAWAANLGAQKVPAPPVALPFLPDGLPLRIGIKEG